MAVSKVIGLGTTLGVKYTTGSSVYTTVAGLLGISGPGAAAEKIDTSTIDNASNFKTFQIGQADPGELSLTLAYGSTDASQKMLAGLLQNRVKTSFEIDYPSSDTPAETFNGYVTGAGREIQKDQLTTRTITVALTGEPGWPATTSS